MNVKQALLILALVLGSLVIFFLALLGLYKFFPEIFGIKTEEKRTEEKIEKIKEDFKTEPKIVLSKYEYDEWLQKSFNAYAIQNENLFLSNYSKYLQDSLNKIVTSYLHNQKKLTEYSDSLKMAYRMLNEKDAENKKILSLLNQKEKELSDLKELIETQQESGKALTDSAKQVVYSTFAKIYENSDPKEVAKIIEILDDKNALAILKSMNKKKAGKIIDMLKPERSAQILEASFK